MKFYIPHPKTLCKEVSMEQEYAYLGLMRDIERSNISSSTDISLVNDIEECEICLLCRSYGTFGFFCDELKRDRKHFDKYFIYSIDDEDFPSLPGVYACSPRRIHQQQGWATTGHYISSHITPFNFDCIPAEKRDILFSFIGSSATHPVRKHLLALHHQDAVIQDSWAKGELPWWGRGDKIQQDYKQNYREVVMRTRFALCPRGVSAASIRLFEVMEAGCVPVIISDALILPRGPRWEDFILRVPEADIERIPEIIGSCSEEFVVRSQAARQCWEQFYSPKASARTILQEIQSLKSNLGERRDLLNSQVVHESFMAPYALRIRARSIKIKLRRMMKRI